MPDTKITALTAIGANPIIPSTFPIPMVDLTDTSMAASGTTKKVTVNQILGSGGTATLASATITGDLTVDTSTLKVDSANNRVGIRTASPAEPLTVDNSSGVTTGAIRIYATDQSHSRLSIQNGNGQAYHLVAGNPGASNAGFALYDNTAAATRWYVDNTGIHTWQNVGGVAGTAMTLNATGLGVGVVPITQARLSLKSSAASPLNLVLQNRDASQNWQFYVDGVVVGDGILTINNGTSSVMQVTPTGNFGIGVTPNSLWAIGKVLQIGSTSGSFLYGSGGQSIAGVNAYYDTAWKYAANGRANYYQQSSGIHSWFYDSGTQVAGTAANFVQAMTLDASGNLFVGKTATGLGTVGIQASPSGWFQATVSGDASLFTNRLASDGKTIQLYRQTLEVGNISVTTTGATFNSTSDYRLKEAVAPLSGGLARVNALKPSVYKWKSNGLSGEGFLAHELAEVVPAAVNGEKDDVNEDGSIKAQSIDMSRVVPILVAAIQELTARVQTLETR